jgi:hypothetical protein
LIKPVAPGPSDWQNTLWLYLRGLPRFAKINPRVSAVQRSWLANLSASLRSGPGGIRRASSKASAARLSQSRLSGRCGVSLLIAPRSSRCLDLSKSFDGKTQISAKLFPP